MLPHYDAALDALLPWTTSYATTVDGVAYVAGLSVNLEYQFRVTLYTGTDVIVSNTAIVNTANTAVHIDEVSTLAAGPRELRVSWPAPEINSPDFAVYGLSLAIVRDNLFNSFWADDPLYASKPKHTVASVVTTPPNAHSCTVSDCTVRCFDSPDGVEVFSAPLFVVGCGIPHIAQNLRSLRTPILPSFLTQGMPGAMDNVPCCCASFGVYWLPRPACGFHRVDHGRRCVCVCLGCVVAHSCLRILRLTNPTPPPPTPQFPTHL